MPPLLHFGKTLLALPVLYTGGWISYYIYTDTSRRLHMRARTLEFERKLAERENGFLLPPSASSGTRAISEVHQGLDLREEDKQLVRDRYASLKIAGRYVNPFPPWREQGMHEWLFWKLIFTPLEVFFKLPYPMIPIPEELDVVHEPNWEVLRSNKEKMGLEGEAKREEGSDGKGRMTWTWIGQSTSFVQMNGLNILTDPIFSDRTLDDVFKGPRRLRPPPCQLKDLPKIDLILVSHNHFDHLDIEAVRELGDSVKWFVPLGCKTWFNNQGVSNVTELDWWQSTLYTPSIPSASSLPPLSLSTSQPSSSSALPSASSPTSSPSPPATSYRITATPAMHWSGRIGLDTNTSLWAGFHVEEIFPLPLCKLDEKSETAEGGKKELQNATGPPGERKGLSFFHAGDTGYSAPLFEGIGQVLGPVTLAAIPIGSYGPRWHLHLHHTDPQGAIHIARQIGAKYSFGVHWGTWIMSDEPPTLPPQDVLVAKQQMGLEHEKSLMRVSPVGLTHVFDC